MDINHDVEAVITSFNQKSMIYEAVHSLCCQTIRPKRIMIVDDGSTDETSVHILNEIEADRNIPVPLLVIRQSNNGVSAARNTGIRKTKAPLILVLDGDDNLEPSFIEEVSKFGAGKPHKQRISRGYRRNEISPTKGIDTPFCSITKCLFQFCRHEISSV